MNVGSIIALAPNEWDGPWMNRQQLLSRLSLRGFPIVFSGGPLSFWERKTEKWKNSAWYSKVFTDLSGVKILHPGQFLSLYPKVPVWDDIVIRFHCQSLKAVESDNGARVVYLFHPKFLPYVDLLKPDYLVYHAYDSFCNAPGWSNELAKMESELIDRCDLFVCSTMAVAEEISSKAVKRAKELLNAVDFDAFHSNENRLCPVDLEDIPRPRISYVGRINVKVDFELILSIATRRPDWHWVLVGPTNLNDLNNMLNNSPSRKFWDELKLCPNVHILGEKNREDLPIYLDNMDVNTMCYRRDSGWWNSGYPLKLHEYLAVGKPIVSTPLSSILNFSHVMAFPKSIDEWEISLKEAIERGGVGTIEERIDTARQNTWDKRVDVLQEWIVEMVNNS